MTALPAGTRLGPYEITAPIGAGGMGEVYRARDALLGRDVAIKVLPAAFLQDAERAARFRREAHLLASLNHPNIAAIYGMQEGDHGGALVLELVEGEDLSSRLRRGAVPVDEAIAIARQIAEALEEAHEKGIVHRDLKPANVKLTPDGKVKVLDFGLAKAWGGDPAAVSSEDLSNSPTLAHTGTAAGVILGTAAYMSPEQARGKPVDKRADVWSFGVVLFEMLTGRRLFAGETVSDTLAAVLKSDPIWTLLPAGVPPAVERVLRRCLERDPRKRLRDVGEARIALQDGAPGDAASFDEATRRRAPVRFVPWTAALVMALVAGWALLSRGSTPPAAPAVLRFDVAFPPDVEPLPSRENGFALSPDGQLVALIGVRNGNRYLFVRRLDSAESTVISQPGLSGAVFSPDGQSVAIVGNRLVCVSLRDGQQTVIAANPDLNAGVAWAPAGVVFARNGELWIGQRQGGAPRALTTLDEDRHEVLHTGHIVVPGGRTVLFSSLTTDAGTERIEAVPVDGGPRSVVVERATTPVLSPTGHLLFARDGAVYAVPFDAGALKVEGSATPVIPAGVIGTAQSGSMGLRLSANGTLLYLPQQFFTQRVVSVGRDGSALALDLPRGQYAAPRISPDGRTLVVVADNNLLEALDLQRGLRGRLAAAASGTSFAAWSRDGARVVSRRFNRPFWVSADAGQQGAIPGAMSNDFPSAAEPDAGSVLVTRVQPETGGDVFLLSIGGAFEPRALIATPAYEGGAQLSPDGRWLAYVSNLSGPSQIYVRRYPALDRQWQLSEGTGIQPRWSASGTELYYRDTKSLMSVAFDGSGAEPVIGKPAALFRDEYDLGQGLTNSNYDVTPDGRFILLRRDAQGGNLRIVLNWTEELKQILARGGAR